ncbi:hypothetical protein XI07_15915 [Bradyrhizobium sp. CCBAU 11445]|nr:hypothetical protein [Bradyrhizobium sp. CCBAU 11445]MDA9523295.1 hypothetical protein [Bradyrhizobium sp. CCBAU 11434]
MLNEAILHFSDLFTSKIMMPDHFCYDEGQELLSKVWVKVGGLCERTQSCCLSLLPTWIGSRHLQSSF